MLSLSNIIVTGARFRKWLVETVSVSRPSNIVPRDPVVGQTAVNLVSKIPGKIQTFWVIALDPDNRLRYPLVSLGFDMRGRLWYRPGVRENLFDIEFWEVKVGGEHHFLQISIFEN